MNIKIYTLLLTLIVSLLAASFFPVHALATVGDNCQIDLISGVSDTQNWNNITILKGSDGYAWRRGTITNPSDELLLKEGETTDISALTGAKAPTQFFIYAANEITPGVLNKPGEGVCFEGPVADNAGLAVFPINARAVWGDLGKKLVLDVFYRLPQKYDEVSGGTSNENSPKKSLQLYDFILPRIVDVKLYTPPSTGSNGSDNPLLNGTQTKPGKWESGSSQPSGSCNFKRTVVSACKIIEDSNYYNDLSEPSEPQAQCRLDPINIDPSLLGSNFDGVGGNPVEIALFRLGSSKNDHGVPSGTSHTHLARIAEDGDGNIKNVELVPLTYKVIALETLKRILNGDYVEDALHNYPTPIGPDLRKDYNIGSLIPENLTKNAETNEILKSIRTLLTGTGDRNAAAAFLNKIVKHTVEVNPSEGTYAPIEPFAQQYLSELFPANTSCQDSWTDAFLNIMLFWTGSTATSETVFSEPGAKNFRPMTRNDYASNNHLWSNILGNTPLLILNTTSPVTLVPDFTDTKIVYSEKEFDNTNSWSLPAGKKQPLDYRYDFIQPFTQKRAGDMCIKKAELSKLASSMQKSYHLTSDEKEVLSQELTSQFPSTSDFVKLSLANPADLASRISWLGNGKPLSILQLFFQLQPGACTSESLTPPALTLPANRDGFEVGIIGH